MDGRHWEAGKFSHSLRLSLWAEHLGLHRGEVSHIMDPMDDSTFKNIWMATAKTNTMIYQDVFSCVPNDLIHSRTQFRQSIAHWREKNWPHYNWSGGRTREVRNLPGWWSQKYWSYGQIAVGQGAPCIFPFGFHVSRGLETIFQWKRVLHVSTSFPLGCLPWKRYPTAALAVHNTWASL